MLHLDERQRDHLATILPIDDLCIALALLFRHFGDNNASHFLYPREARVGDHQPVIAITVAGDRRNWDKYFPVERFIFDQLCEQNLLDGEDSGDPNDDRMHLNERGRQHYANQCFGEIRIACETLAPKRYKRLSTITRNNLVICRALGTHQNRVGILLQHDSDPANKVCFVFPKQQAVVEQLHGDYYAALLKFDRET